VKVSSYCYITHLINNQTIKYTKQNHSNCSKCPAWDPMYFSTRVTSDWVASAMVLGWLRMCSAAEKKRRSSAGHLSTSVSYTKPPSSGRPDDGGSKNLWNVGKFSPDYTSQQSRRQKSSHSQMFDYKWYQSMNGIKAPGMYLIGRKGQPHVSESKLKLPE
jgi:hypothetical protein